MWIRFALFNAALAAALTALPRRAMTALNVHVPTTPLRVGTSQRFVATPVSVTAAHVRLRYEIADTSVAQVDSTGRVTGRAVGSTTMTVRARADAAGFVETEASERVAITIR